MIELFAYGHDMAASVVEQQQTTKRMCLSAGAGAELQRHHLNTGQRAEAQVYQSKLLHKTQPACTLLGTQY